jgi:hypothetical protein
MKIIIKSFCAIALLLSMGVILSSFLNTPTKYRSRISFPYKKAGLTERQAAAHLWLKVFPFQNRCW